jgi:sterol 3beta-glucosyltransferase
MRVGLQSWGTEGDLRPFLALGQALQRRGHDVKLVFTSIEGKDFTSLAASTGVETRFVDDGYFVANREELGQRTREGLKASPTKQLELVLKHLMDPVVDSMLDAARALAADSDVVVGHFIAHTAAAAAAEHAKPYVLVALQPVFASAHYPPSGVPALGRFFNPLLWKLADHVMDKSLRGRMNASRARCGLPSKKRFKAIELGDPRSVLVAVSPSLFLRPPDWSSLLDICGFFGLHEPALQAWEPEARVEAFLSEGAPVYLSFGSMFGMDDRQTLEAVEIFAAALALGGARGIVQAPPSGSAPCSTIHRWPSARPRSLAA